MATPAASTKSSESRRRLAFIVGIENYEICPPLRNPVNDANTMESILERLGFIVTKLLDSTSLDFQNTLNKFKSEIRENDIVLFYFSGHGTQWDGQNYLIPQDISSLSVQDLKKKAINAQRALDSLSDMKPFAVIFLLDCCRSYPLVTSDENKSRPRTANTSPLGLQAMQMAGSLIAYACAPGAIANDGDEQSNGLFTKHLLEHITSRDDILTILCNVTDGVRNESEDQQIPYLSVSLAKKIYLVEKESKPPIKSEPIPNIVRILDKDLKLDDEIGHGAFGIVYRARWLSQHQYVAVKRLHLTQLDKQAEKTFFEELLVLQKLRHPHIINLYGACLEPGKYSVVMEYMSLGSLYQVLHTDKLLLEWSDRLSIALQTAKGTNYLHKLKPPVFHRDIKSLNILLHSSQDGYVVKLCDFGLAKIRNETTQRSLLSQSLPCTLQWTAPEILSMRTYTKKSDVYSLGVVFWEIATNEIPYGQSKPDIICVFVLRGDRLKIPETTQPSFSSLIEKCWAHKPKDRPTCSQIIRAIQCCAETRDAASEKDDMTTLDEGCISSDPTILSSASESARPIENELGLANAIEEKMENMNIESSPILPDAAVNTHKMSWVDSVDISNIPNVQHTSNTTATLMLALAPTTMIQSSSVRRDPATNMYNMTGMQSKQTPKPTKSPSKRDALVKWAQTKMDLKNPATPNVTIEILPVRRVIPNLPANATWEQQGVTVAGGNGQSGEKNQLFGPLGLFVDDDDDQTMVIADWGNHRIMKWKKDDTEGQIVAGGNGRGIRLDQLNHPSDVLIDKATNSLIIADQGNRRIVRWSRLSGTTEGDILIRNRRCSRLAMDEQRNLYVSDYKKHEVRRYEIDRGDRLGVVVVGGKGPGSGLNQLDYHEFLFVDRHQSLYVSDNDNHRVMKWDKGTTHGVVVAGGQGEGTALTQLWRPNGIFVDTSGTVYVVDSGNHRVTRWSQGSERKGTLVVGGNGYGSGADQFSHPVGLSFDKHGNLYVADHYNNRVQRFNIVK